MSTTNELFLVSFKICCTTYSTAPNDEPSKGKASEMGGNIDYPPQSSDGVLLLVSPLASLLLSIHYWNGADENTHIFLAFLPAILPPGYYIFLCSFLLLLSVPPWKYANRYQVPKANCEQQMRLF